MKKFRLWQKTIRAWLNRARHFWLAITVAIVPFVWIYTNPCEPSVRITGLFLQFFGIATVAWGIRETRKLFNHPSFFEKAIEWMKSFPPYEGRTSSGSASASLGKLTGQAHSHNFNPIDPNSSVEERLDSITKNINIIYDRLNHTERDIDTKTKSITEAINQEKAIREQAFKETHNKIESANAGGLHISAMGVFWLFIGVTLSTASAEISKYLL